MIVDVQEIAGIKIVADENVFPAVQIKIGDGNGMPIALDSHAGFFCNVGEYGMIQAIIPVIPE